MLRGSRVVIATVLMLPLAGRADGAGTLHAAYYHDSYSTDATGSNTAVSWVGTPLPGLTAELGAARSIVEDARWRYGIAAGVFGLRDNRDILSARIESGSGDDATGPFDYKRQRAGWQHALQPGRWFLDTDFTRVKAGDSEVNLGRIGAIAVHGIVQIQGHWGREFSSSADDRDSTADLRVDIVTTDAIYFVGITRGSTIEIVPTASGTVRAVSDTREWYAGADIPVGRHGVVISVSRLDLGSAERTQFAIAGRWALGK